MTDLMIDGEADDAKVDLDMIDRQIRDGLPAERERLLIARKNQVYYDGDNDGEIPSRPSEDRLDYDMRPKLISYMTRKVINSLTCHTYAPGPERKLGDESATLWLGRVYRDNGVNAILKDVDRLAHLQGVSAVQVAATGDPNRPIRLHVWGAEELVVWCPFDDVLTPHAVCAITEDNGETVFTLYTPDIVRRYRERRSSSGTAQDIIRQDGPDMPNPYGRLPFVFVHYERPTRRFWTRGVGSLLRKINARVDEKMSELAEAQRFYLKPIPLAYNTPPGWRPKIAPGRFVSVPFKPGANGLPSAEPRIEFLQAEVNVESAWNDITNTIDTALSDLDIPLAAYRAEQSSAKSGAAMVTEQSSLLVYARNRRFYYASTEEELAKAVLFIGGSYDDGGDASVKSALLTEADDIHMTLAWPDNLRVPTMEDANVQSQDIDLGLTSQIKIIMQERGFDRQQAMLELAEIVSDQALYHQLMAQAGLPPSPEQVNQDDPDTDEGDGEPDPEVGQDPVASIKPGDAVVPVRDNTPSDPTALPGYM